MIPSRPCPAVAFGVSYQYGPFGELLRATGPMAKLNPFRFSTKYQDDETDLLYCGYRYYNASTGRWIGCDPIGEGGGQNLYCYVDNSTVSHVDILGLIPPADVRWWPPPERNPPRVPPSPAGEVVVTLPVPDANNPDNGFLINNLDYVVNHASDNGFTYIIVRDPGGLNMKLKKVCGCIGKLIITGHGGPGTQVYGPGDSYSLDRELTVTYPQGVREPVIQNIGLFSGVKFCKPCAIVLAGCAVATGPDWRVLMQGIRDKTGCSVWAYTTLGTCPRDGRTSGPQPPGHWEGTE